MSTIRGMRTTSSVPSGLQPLNFSKVIFNPELHGDGYSYDDTLFRMLYKLGKGLGQPTTWRRFQVGDDSLLQRQTYILSIATATATSFTVPSNIGLLIRRGFMLYNYNTTERYYVESVVGDTITVQRDWGSYLGGASASTANSDNLLAACVSPYDLEVVS